MTKRSFFLLLTLLFAIPGRAADKSDPIVQAAMDFVKTNSGMKDPLVTDEKVAGNYARVKITSRSGATDPAMAFLKLKNGQWKVLEMGTSFGPDDYKRLNIPASLQGW